MRRGNVYRVRRPEGDPKSHRSFVIVSRQAVIDSGYSTLVCAPIYSQGDGLETQVGVGPNEGLRRVRKSDLTQFIGSLSSTKLEELNQALKVALALEESEYF